MHIKEFINQLSKLRKKHPEAQIFFMTDTTENGLFSIQHVVMCYAKNEEIQNNNIKEDTCIKEPKEGYSAVIVIG